MSDSNGEKAAAYDPFDGGGPINLSGHQLAQVQAWTALLAHERLEQRLRALRRAEAIARGDETL